MSASVSKAHKLVRFTLEFTCQKIKISLKILLTEKRNEIWMNCSYWVSEDVLVRKQDVRGALTVFKEGMHFAWKRLKGI